MSISIGIARSALEFARRGYFNNMDNVMDMGAQSLHVEKNDFLKITKSYGYQPDLNNFPLIDNFQKKNYLNTESSKPFWKMLGFKNTDCLDIIDKYNAKIVNLNEPLKDKSLFNSYDLVTDFGNNEHPFNTAEAYRTMHRMCKKNGLMWTCQALYGNNGFYNYDVSFFESIAAANQYVIVNSYLTCWTEKDQDCLRLPLSLSLINCLDLHKADIGISYLFRKTSDNDFSFPMQHQIKSGNDWENGDTFFTPVMMPETTDLGITPSRVYVPTKISNHQALKKLLSTIRKKIFKR